MAKSNSGRDGDLSDMEPVDPVEALEYDLARERRTTLLNSRVASPVGTTEKAKESSQPERPEQPTEAVAGDDAPYRTRGEANFNAWRETRRSLDGEDASFEVEFVSSDGETVRLDLLKTAFAELPEELRAEFETRKFPDFTSLHHESAAEGDERRDEEQHAEPSRHEPARSDRDRQERRPGTESETEAESDAERPHVAPAGGFGLNLGGLLGGATRAAAKALGQMGKHLNTQGLQGWHEKRAAQHLGQLDGAMEDFGSALNHVREHPELKDVFKSWDKLSTEAGRKNAIERFAEKLRTGTFSPDATRLVDDLFNRAGVLRHLTDRTLKAVYKADGDVGAVKEKMLEWTKGIQSKAGPIANRMGEALSDHIKALSESIRRALEKLVQRIASFAAPRMS